MDLICINSSWRNLIRSIWGRNSSLSSSSSIVLTIVHDRFITYSHASMHQIILLYISQQLTVAIQSVLFPIFVHPSTFDVFEPLSIPSYPHPNVSSNIQIPLNLLSCSRERSVPELACFPLVSQTEDDYIN